MVVNLKNRPTDSAVESKPARAMRGPAKILLALVFLGILATLLLAFSFNRTADSWQFGSDSTAPRQTIR